MKAISWRTCWLLAICICFSDAKSKIRRPLPPSYALILKEPQPISHRKSVGNAVHIGGNFPYQRVPPYKSVNYRPVRRPVHKVLSTNWKNQMPIRTIMNNRAVLPQRAPMKEFHSINNVPEFSPEYRPELVMLPATHRGGFDDDKGPIHTIPAPNLSPADKPSNSPGDPKENRLPYFSDLGYQTTAQNPNVVSNIDLAAISSGPLPQKIATSALQHHYEVTESNDVTVLKDRENSIQSATFQPQNLGATGLYSTIINPYSQPDELFVSQPVNGNTVGIGPSVVQFPQSSVPMKTNLHSSLYVGFPATAVQTPYTVAQQVPELHVGHPTTAGPPLSATQLYDLLNSFPQHKVAEQYTPDQQHILQQLDQVLQPDAITSFFQPQMHSFNYDEQANQLQQQQQHQLSLNQDYTSENMTVDYNMDPRTPVDLRKQTVEFPYPPDKVEQSENNIEYDGSNHHRGPRPYSKNTNIHDPIGMNFYTTLPNRKAAEKLAALAAAGNVNSHLMDQLRKQQQQEKSIQSDMPHNHKDDNASQETQTHNDQSQRYNPYRYHRNQQQRKQGYKNSQNESKVPLQITVPEQEEEEEEEEYVPEDQLGDIKKKNVEYEYEEEDEDGKIEESSFDEQNVSQERDHHVEFGSRLQPKTRK